jgi:hypothetical protein
MKCLFAYYGLTFFGKISGMDFLVSNEPFWSFFSYLRFLIYSISSFLDLTLL